MLGTTIVLDPPPVEVPDLTFNNDLFMARTTVFLGRRATDNDRAEFVGISRNMLNRLRGGDVGLSLRRAISIVDRLGVKLHDLFPPA